MSIVCLVYVDNVQCDVRMYLVHSVNIALNHSSAITAQKNEEILNGKLYFLCSVYLCDGYCVFSVC